MKIEGSITQELVDNCFHRLQFNGERILIEPQFQTTGRARYSYLKKSKYFWETLPNIFVDNLRNILY